MKAIVFDHYGPADVLQAVDLPTPNPRPNEVRIKVFAANVSAEDPKLRAFAHPALLRIPIGLLFGFGRPRLRILGMELSGEIDEVGSLVKRFKPGDEVFGYTGIWHGAYAEYRCLPENALITHKPKQLSFVDAAATPNGALTALVYLRSFARVQRGEHVLVYGASGAVGTAAIQLAKHLGARVTGVCSARNVELVRSLGADAVIDYQYEDFTQGQCTYDVVFDTVTKLSFERVKPVLTRDGRYLVTQFGLRELAHMAWTSLTSGKKIKGGASNFHWSLELLEELSELVRSGTVRSVVDRCYPLHEVVAAHRYVERGRKRGNVVLTIGAT